MLQHLRRQAAKREEVADRPVWESHVCCSEIIEASCRSRSCKDDTLLCVLWGFLLYVEKPHHIERDADMNFGINFRN